METTTVNHKCGACNPEVHKKQSLDENVRDFIRYHASPKYKKHIRAAYRALKKL